MKVELAPVEACGRSHTRRTLLLLGEDETNEAGSVESKGSSVKEAVIAVRKLTPEEVPGMNKYELLGVDKFGLGVDDNVLKRAYHRALLTYHPDKNSADPDEEEEDEVFLAIQDAHTILSDPVKRRAYDSTNDFDETIPNGKEEGVNGAVFDFYAAYAPVFRSNGRFSNNPRVPELGDDSAPIDEVNRFYEFWTRFSSWRDFSLDAPEHDVEAAECREEKRWMAKENEKVSKQKKNDDNARISLLIDRSRAIDPRLKRAREDELRAKNEAKDAKMAEARKKQDAAREAAEVEAKLAEEVKKTADAAKQNDKLNTMQAKKASRKIKNALRKAHADKDSADFKKKRVSMEDIEYLCDTLDDDDIVRVTGLFCSDVVKWEAIEELISETKSAKDAKAAAAALLAKHCVVSKPTSRKWSVDERSMLAKAAIKFPAGAAQRWETISAFVNTQLALSEPRSKDECIAEYKMIEASLGKKNATPATESSWSDGQQKELEDGLKANPASMDANERWSAIASKVDGKTKKECVARFKELREKLKK